MFIYNMRTFAFWPRVLKSHKHLHFNGIFGTKVNNIWTEKYRGVIFRETKEWCKIQRKIDMCFQKLKGIWKNFTRASKSLKIGTLIGSFYPKKRMYEVKTYRPVMCHENKEQNLKRNWLVSSKLTRGEFWAERSKMSNICTLIGRFWTKYKMFELKSTGALCFRTLKINAKFDRKLICTFKNDIRISQIFTGWEIAISF